MTEPAIEVSALGKRYWKIREPSLVRSLVPMGPPNRTQLWALRDVNLQVEPGETLGIIGPNGAGKSTMLRLLAGVTRPTTGTVVTRGRVAPLLSVGVGFHQEMSGRENVYVNGMLLGLSRSRIDALFDDIVDFADLHEFIDTPVKFYSSGMYMRLGFSVAIHVDPEVLLVDEVLAVGDVGFHLRSFERMRALQRSGTAIVFVSHWLQLVQVLCPRAVCLHHGSVAFDGPTEAAIGRYHELLAGDESADGAVTAAVTPISRQLLDDHGVAVRSVHQDDRLTYRMRLRFERPVESPQILFRVVGEDEREVYQRQTAVGEAWRSFMPREETEVAVTFAPRFGGGGTFRITVVVTDRECAETLFHDTNGLAFFVEPRPGVVGVADLDASISIDDQNRTDLRTLRFDSEPSVGEGA